MQLEQRYQGIMFDEHPPGLDELRTITRRQCRDALRAARREQALADKPNVVQEALRYADILARNPELTKGQFAADLGISRIRVYQMLNVLKLAEPILGFIIANDTPEYKEILTERRLRSLTKIGDEVTQIALFREILTRAES